MKDIQERLKAEMTLAQAHQEEYANRTRPRRRRVVLRGKP